jgi:hypothetical protein
MLVLFTYLGAVVTWVGVHVVLELLRTRQILSVSQIRLSLHFVQVILVTAAAVFDLRMRPDLAAQFVGSILAWGPYVLIYGLPYGTLVFLAVFCTGADCVRMYVRPSAKSSQVMISWSFWTGLAFLVLIPLFVMHALATGGDRFYP